MKKLNDKARIDNYLMTLLKVDLIAHPLFDTSKGPLYLNIRKGGIGKDYFITLDAVPVEEKKQQEILELLGLTD